MTFYHGFVPEKEKLITAVPLQKRNTDKLIVVHAWERSVQATRSQLREAIEKVLVFCKCLMRITST